MCLSISSDDLVAHSCLFVSLLAGTICAQAFFQILRQKLSIADFIATAALNMLERTCSRMVYLSNGFWSAMGPKFLDLSCPPQA